MELLWLTHYQRKNTRLWDDSRGKKEVIKYDTGKKYFDRTDNSLQTYKDKEKIKDDIGIKLGLQMKKPNSRLHLK